MIVYYINYDLNMNKGIRDYIKLVNLFSCSNSDEKLILSFSSAFSIEVRRALKKSEYLRFSISFDMRLASRNSKSFSPTGDFKLAMCKKTSPKEKTSDLSQLCCLT